MRMVPRIIASCVLALLGAGATAAAATPAWADDPDQLTITGGDLPEPLVVRGAERPRLAQALYREVSWLSSEADEADEPEEDARGPAYQLDVHAGGEARQRYVLYPLAEGGPRVHRPAEQPGDRSTDAAWFYGRLSLPETLAAAGVPIPGAQPVLPGGGIGGGADNGASAPAADAAGVLSTWREGLQLTALAAVGIVAGLGVVALLIRRKV